MTANVYHIDYQNTEDRELSLNIRLSPTQGDVKKALQANLYTKVAEVDSNDLEHIFELTNSIHNYWGENKGVTLITLKNRSTSVGDIVELDGKAHLVAGHGYKELSDEIFSLLPQKKTKKHGLN